MNKSTNGSTGFSLQTVLKFIALLTALYLMYSMNANAQSCNLSVSVTSKDVICQGSNTGFVDLTITGATGSVTVLWSNGSTSEDIFGVPVGVYTATVSDIIGCTITITDTVHDVDFDSTLALSAVNPICGSNNGAVILSTSQPALQVLPIITNQSGDTIDYDFGSFNGTSISSLPIPGGTYTSKFETTDLLSAYSKSAFINTPSSITGSLTTTYGTFTPQLTSTPITADVILVDDGFAITSDGCQTILNNLAGKIALIDRGSCTFSLKITNAENAGAIAVIIINQNIGEVPLTMNGTSVNIPAVMINSYEGDKIKNELTSGGTVNITLQDYVPVSDQDTSCFIFCDSVTLINTGSITASCSKTDVTCYGSADGEASVTVSSNATPPFSYQWNTMPTQTTATATGLAPGNYIATVVDSNGCTGSCTVTITQPDPLLITLDEQINVLCWGDNTGSLSVSVSGGTAPYTYLWSNGETTEDIDSLYAGTYTLTVTGSNTCTTSRTFNVSQNPRYVKGSQISNVTCHNGSDGHIRLFVNGAVSPYTFQWSNGDTSFEADSLSAGTYTVTITDAVGCDTICEYWILEPTLLDATVSVNNISCNGLSDGSATVFPTGGTPYSGGGYMYQWSNGQTTQTATGLPAGTHQVVISDSLWCVTIVVVQVTQPSTMICFQSVNDVSCYGGSNGSIQVVVNGGTSPYSYNWSTGATTSLINGLTAGTYTLTVTDANLCTKTQNYIVNQAAQIQYTLSSVDATCYGSNDGKGIVNINGGGSGYSYVWNSNPIQTTAVASNLGVGNYVVIITDASGCTTIDSISISQPAEIVSNASLTSPSCNGGSDGSISLIINGGTSPYSIIWSNGNTTNNNTGLNSGTYTVTITDSAGCVLTESHTISDPTAIDLSGTTVIHVGCNGATNGSIIANVIGGTFPYSFLWNTGDTTSILQNIGAGTYSLIVTDANGCTATGIWTVTEPAELTCLCNSNVNNVTCHGASNGNVTAIPSGGTAPYTYQWSTGASSQSIVGLSAGTYTVTITDANGCIKIGVATVTEPAPLTCSANITNILCNGANTGAVALVVSGGTPPYSYQWSTGATTSAVANLSIGSYAVTVTDVNNCTFVKNFNITAPPAISVTTTKLNVSCKGGSNGTASIFPSGGTAPYSYLWSNGATTSYVI
ncbi:MAG: hypothetical protein HKN22_06425, partial [Bacteroidia bacterium]|nr:hypothetical protein [Bacteroidia bacterium]